MLDYQNSCNKHYLKYMPEDDNSKTFLHNYRKTGRYPLCYLELNVTWRCSFNNCVTTSKKKSWMLPEICLTLLRVCDNFVTSKLYVALQRPLKTATKLHASVLNIHVKISGEGTSCVVIVADWDPRKTTSLSHASSYTCTEYQSKEVSTVLGLQADFLWIVTCARKERLL